MVGALSLHRALGQFHVSKRVTWRPHPGGGFQVGSFRPSKGRRQPVMKDWDHPPLESSCPGCETPVVQPEGWLLLPVLWLQLPL